MLLILPVKDNIPLLIGWSNNSALTIYNYLDELTVAIYFLPAIWLLYKNREELPSFYFYLILAIFVFCLSGEISGMINGNSFFVTTMGIIDYIKSFLVFFIYAAFFRTYEEFRKIYRLLLITAVFFGLLSFAEEMWALVNRYLLGKNIYNIDYLLNKTLYIPELAWRFGLYRATSLFNNANSFGFHCLLILVVYLQAAKKRNKIILFILFCGIYFTLSRMVYAGFLFIVGTIIVFKKRRLIRFIAVVTLIPVVILLIYMAAFPDFNLISYMSGGDIHSDDAIPFRVYTVNKSMEIWKDHPIWGVGPGLFGGVVSLICNSHIYRLYDFNPQVISLINEWRAVDQFWPRVLGEIGIVGTLLFIHILILVPIECFIMIRQKNHDDLKKLLTGIAIYLLIVLIMTTGGGISFSLMYVYYAVAGIVFGMIKKNEFRAQ